MFDKKDKAGKGEMPVLPFMRNPRRGLSHISPVK
jgi:hypothetical protein